jgi:hypothetical protein
MYRTKGLEIEKAHLFSHVFAVIDVKFCEPLMQPRQNLHK